MSNTKQPHTFVVGGTAGMGFATARALLQRGHRVTVASRTPGKVESAAAALGVGAQGAVIDMLDESSVERALAASEPFQHLVLAGSGRVKWGPIGDVPGGAVLRALEYKLVGYWTCIRAAAPRLAQEGSVTLFSGAASRKSMPGTAALAAVNGGINAMARTLATELAPVRVNVISPGLVATEAYDPMPEEARSQLFEQAANSLPIGRLGLAPEVGGAAAELVSNSYITGALLDCDGGHQL